MYVLYAYDFDPAHPTDIPRWGTPGVYSDPCPTPPGPTADGCVVMGRLSRLEAAGNVMTGSEQVLLQDWCQQYPSHSIGSLAFGADGMLYVTGGDGASFNFVDYGHDGNPVNPCGDPPGPVPPNPPPAPPTAEGGALRSQDVRTSGDPATLDGAVLRIDPSTGAAAPGNPNAGSADPNVRRIVAHGLRNPFRFTIRPGTNEVWVGDVGWNVWEEINRVVNPTGGVANFGWPCYEGGVDSNLVPVSLRQSGYDDANLSICENLYAAGAGAVAAPHFAYNHSSSVVGGDGCPTGGSSLAGLAFYQGGSYPSDFANALFFADYSRNCIWVMKAGANGLPEPGAHHTVRRGRRRSRPICRSGREETSSTPATTTGMCTGSGSWEEALHPRRASSPRTGSTRELGRPSRMLRARAMPGRSGRRPGRRWARTATRSASTAPLRGSLSPMHRRFASRRR